MAGPLILIANPGSASRKYALYQAEILRGELHFEWLRGKVVCTLKRSVDQQEAILLDIPDLTMAAGQVVTIFESKGVLRKGEMIRRIGLRIVAPGAYFLQDRIIDKAFIDHLEAAKLHAPLHIAATLQELYTLQKQFTVPVVGISDSAFHSTKPEHAWNYGLPLSDVDRFDIKRFGYHGLSVASVVGALEAIDAHNAKTIVCHLGSGVSVSAVQDGKSVDTTMGYSPLEGAIMATRSGSIDWSAAQALKTALRLDDAAFETYLNTASGLQGLGGSSDIRELLEREADGDHYAHLALETYIYNIQKAVGQMTAALNGVDQLVFTGTVGERSAAIRERTLHRFEYLNLVLNKQDNANCIAPNEATDISLGAHPKPIYVIPANESWAMAQRARQIMTP